MCAKVFGKSNENTSLRLQPVLFGDVNPSGRLPLTFPNVENEIGFTERQYPGLDDASEAYYDEQLLVGYRWYDAKGVAPAFAFGHGLSYTSFNYSHLHISGMNITLTITNTGKVFCLEHTLVLY